MKTALYIMIMVTVHNKIIDVEVTVVDNRGMLIQCVTNKDNEPLITILDKKVASDEMKITCKACHSIYEKIKYQ